MDSIVRSLTAPLPLLVPSAVQLLGCHLPQCPCIQESIQCLHMDAFALEVVQSVNDLDHRPPASIQLAYAEAVP